MPYSVATSTTLSSEPLPEGRIMEQNRIDNDTELVTETLVEEVSIDGMCGVY